MRLITYLFILVLVVLGITFAELNADPVVLNYYVGVHQFPLSILLLASLGCGVTIGILFTSGTIFRLKRKNLRLKSQVKQAEKEVSNLRAIPIKDSH